MGSRLCFALIILLAVQTAVGAQAGGDDAAWTVVSDAPVGDGRQDWYRMSFADAWNGWIVGGQIGPGVEDSFIGIKTSDGGRTWRDIHIPHFRASLVGGRPRFNEQGVEERLAGARAYSVHLVTPNEAWVGGATRLAHTRDGGLTWDTIHLDDALPDTPDVRFVASQGRLNVYAVHFWNRGDGLMAILAQQLGEGTVKAGMVLSTTDGGSSWDLATLRVAGSVSMWSRTDGWMTSGVASGLYATTTNWRSSRRLLDGVVTSAYLAEDGRAWAVASPVPRVEPQTILHSEDSGETWNLSDIEGTAPAGGIGARVLAFAPDGVGWVGGGDSDGNGLIMTTHDGLSWTYEETPVRSEVMAMQYVDGAVYAVARDGMVVRRGPAPPRPGPVDSLKTKWGQLKRDRSSTKE